MHTLAYWTRLCGLVIIALVLVAGGHQISFGQIPASWLTASDGYWDAAVNWSTNPHYPNNKDTSGISYDVAIDASGAAYVVKLNDDITLHGLTIDSPDVTLRHLGHTFQVDTPIDLRSGTYQLVNATLYDSTIVGHGGRLEVTDQPTLDHVTLDIDLNINHDADTYMMGTLTIESGRTVWLNSDGDGTSQYVTNLRSITFGDRIEGAGKIVFAGPGDGMCVTATSGSLTIGSDMTILTQGGSGRIGDASTLRYIRSITNDGAIVASDGHTLKVGIAETDYGTFANHGTLEASNGGTIETLGVWTSTGTLRVNQATLILGGEFDTASLDALDRTGGLIRVTGTINNTGDTLVLDASKGVIEFGQGAKVVNGTITTTDANELLFVNGSSTFENVAVDADIRVKQSAIITMNGGSVSADNRKIIFDTQYNDSPVLSLPADTVMNGVTQVLFEGTGGQGELGPVSGTLTVGPDVVVKTQGSSGKIGNTHYPLIFQGTALAQTPGTVLGIQGNGVTNQGQLQASNGARLSVYGLTGDVGNVSVSGAGSELVLYGNFNIDQDILVPEGAMLRVRGTWTNSATVTVDNATLQLDGTTTNPGNIVTTDSHIQILGQFTTAQIDSIDDTATTYSLGYGCVITNTGDILNLTAETGSWSMAGARINGGSIQATGGVQLNIEIASSPSNILDSVTINTPVVLANNASLSLYGDWQNNDTITINGGGLFMRGTFATSDIGTIVRNSGSVSIYGAMDNTASIFELNDDTGDVYFILGSITGGRINSANGRGLIVRENFSATLNSVTLAAPMTVQSRSSVTVSGGLAMDGGRITLEGSTDTVYPGTYLRISGSQSISGSGEILFGGASAYSTVSSDSGSLTIGSEITIRTDNQGGTIGYPWTGVINQGTIRADGAGRIILLEPGTMENTGRIESANDGSVVISTAAWINQGTIHIDHAEVTITSSTFTNASGGRIEGVGTLDVSAVGTFVNQGYIAPGLSPGTLVILGDFVQESTGILEMEIAGVQAGQFDQLVITGNASIDGTLLISLIGPVSSIPVDMMLLSATNLSGTFDQILINGPHSDAYQVIVDGNSILLVTQGAVPEPHMMLLMISSIGLVMSKRRYHR